MAAIKAKLNPPADTEAAPIDDSDAEAAAETEATDDEGADAAEEQAAQSEGEDDAAADAAEELAQGFLRHARQHKQVERRARSSARHVHHHERRARKHHRARPVAPEEEDDTDFSAPEVTDY